MLLSQALLAFTLEFERDSELSLPLCANVMRLLSDEGVRVRDLPRQSGVSKEALEISLGFLEKRGYAVVESAPNGSRTRLVRLTPKGREAGDADRQRLAVLEKSWRVRFSEDEIRGLREALQGLVGEPTAGRSRLFGGLEPYPDGWRALILKPSTLPHHPMVLHRGGFPDGS